ncbi:unnamed protein product [Amaranthus hypochondriacus]
MLAFFHLLLYFTLLILCANQSFLIDAKLYNRYDFPFDFIFGASTSAYQVEGAAFEDGRKTSIFDTFAHSGRFLKSNGDVAADAYHKYKEDVKLMKETGLDAYRFSISWSRLIPDGRGALNPKGVEYYNNLIDELVNNGIQPHVTLMHFDVPQALEDEYGGFLSHSIIEDFTAYADVCFRIFGDRVQYWTTINEGNMFAFGSYDTGFSPPSRCSFPFGHQCIKGDSTTEPYIVAHNLLLAHASVAKLYKEKYQSKQHGFLGISLYGFHFSPLRNTTADVIAAQRSYVFFIGWLMHPLTIGDYPKIMKRNVGCRLPTFTKNQSELIKGSFDFVGLNYYTVMSVKHRTLVPKPRDYVADMAAEWIYYNHSSAIPIDITAYPVLPWGLQGILEYFKTVYNNPPIYIYENGQMTNYDTTVNDPSRVEYLQAFIGGLLDSVREGSNTKGYFVWSFVDAFELLYGYNYTFGLYYVNFSDPNQTRYPKISQRWYSNFLKGGNVSTDDEDSQHENMLTVYKPVVDMLNRFSI